MPTGIFCLELNERLPDTGYYTFLQDYIIDVARLFEL